MARTQRDRLIDAMARTVAARGYADTALTEVCAAAGVSTRAFYEQFADKEDCFLATFELGAGLLQRSVRAAYEHPAPWPLRIRRALDQLLRVLAAEPAFANLAVVEMLAAGPRALRRRRVFLANYLQFFEDAPCRAGRPRVPPETVEAIVAGVHGVIFNEVAMGRVAELPRRLPGLTYFVLVPFIGPRAAASAAGLGGRD